MPLCQCAMSDAVAEAAAWQKKDVDADGAGAFAKAPPHSLVFTQEACSAFVDRCISYGATLENLDSLCALMMPDVVVDYGDGIGIRGVEAYRAHTVAAFREMSRSSVARSAVVARAGPVVVGALVPLSLPAPGPNEVDIVVRAHCTGSKEVRWGGGGRVCGVAFERCNSCE